MADTPDAELAKIFLEALEQVAAGETTREDLLHTLESVRLRGRVPLNRLVQRTGAGAKLRGDLGGWVLSVSDLDPSLATVLQNLDLDLPTTTTGMHALTFLRHTWEQKPVRVDEMRRHFASAYRYVLLDAEGDQALAKAWGEARDHAHLYGSRSWHPIGPDLAVDDVQSPLIRRFMPDDRVIVASAHLGDTSEHVGRVAKALRLRLLSEEVTVRHGSWMADPPYVERLLRLVQTLSSLEDRRSLDQIVFFEDLALRVGGADYAISAYIDDGELLLAGEPLSFAVEAAGQLVEYFQLSQRGSDVAWLTGSLFALDDSQGFERNLGVLADGLGVTLREIPEPNDGEEDRVGDHDDSSMPGDGYGDPGVEANQGTRADNLPGNEGASDGGGLDGPAGVADSGTRGGKGSGSPGSSHGGGIRVGGRGSSGPRTTSPRKKPSPGSRAANHFRLLLVSSSGDGEHGDSESGRRNKKDDHKARRAVVAYETRRGRRAKAMDDNQPGFDVLSEDPSTGCRRRIEVKGVQGVFEEEASVVLTSRQVHDAIQHDEDDLEYWLYVVDSTETKCPRVFPIPWTRHRSHLRYGFYASAWVGDAEQPAVPTTNGLDELSPEALEPSEAGDLDEDYDPEGVGE